MGVIDSADIGDISAITFLKYKMFKEVGMEHFLRDDIIQEVEKVYKELYHSGTAKHFIIRKDQQIIACAGGFLKNDLPYCFFKEYEYGFIGDVYVEPDFRKKG